MAGVPLWNGTPEEAAAWDSCWIGGLFLPGIVKIKVRKVRDIDTQKSPEVDGATQVNKGITPAELSIELTLYDNPDAWAQWLKVLPQIDPHKPGAYQQPHEIVNPEPNHLGINKITITDIESESPTSAGGKKYTIKAQQWFPKPKPAKSKKTAKNHGVIEIPEIEVRPSPDFWKNSA